MNIRETTLDRFGTELGEHLLANRAILPTMDKKPAMDIRGYNGGVDLSQRHGPYNGLAVINGPLSNILVIDFDDSNLNPPAPFNVETTKGGHVYTKWAGQRRKIGIAPGVDLLGQGGYAEFAGAGRHFIRLPSLTRPQSWHG